MSYFDSSNTVARVFSASAVKYGMFVLLPRFVVFSVVGMYTESALAIALACGLYVATTILLQLVSAAIGGSRFTSRKAAGLVVSAMGSGLAAVLAAPIGPRLASMAPTAGDILGNVLAAGLVAVLILSFQKATDHSGDQLGVLSCEVRDAVIGIALENNVDPRIGLALGLVENDQRPSWLRNLERRTHRIRPNGSYGLFQVKGEGPVTDIESCRIAMARLEGSQPLTAELGRPVAWSVRAIAERHNPDAEFADAVVEKVEYLSVSPQAESEGSSPDHRPAIEIWHVGRWREQLRIRGTAWLSDDQTEVTVSVVPGSEMVTKVNGESGSRVSWYADIPHRSRTVSAQVGEESVSVNLTDSGVVVRDIGLRGDSDGLRS